MTLRLSLQGRPRVNRRAFLRGAAGVSIALPFLESLPERSAWAMGAEPVFSFFLCAVSGVITEHFFPSLGPLTTEGLAAAGKATSHLSRHAENLLFLKGINWPMNSPTGEPHAQGFCMALTAVPPVGSGSNAMGNGPSADVVIASKVHPGSPPLTLYAGNLNNGYIAERLSFSGPGEVVAANDNPYTLYQELVGILPSGGMPDGSPADLLLQSRQSVHDLVLDELTTLMNHPRLSSADHQRLQQHFDAIRAVEMRMDDMGEEAMERCSSQGLDITKLEALETFAFRMDGMIEEVVELHMSLVALAFACNYRRTATLQWGDGTDGTIYDVPSNERRWTFNHIAHRQQSDSGAGNDQLAEVAHAEIDALRMQTLAAGLDHFAARGLEDQCFVMWTNHFADSPAHSYRNVPHILWGNGGGYLKQGEYVDVGSTANDRLLNTLISAAIQDTGEIVDDFGEGDGGELESIRG